MAKSKVLTQIAKSNSIKRLFWDLFDTKATYLFNIISYFCTIFDVGICGLVLSKIKYTEIDWSTYMQQVEVYRNENDYNYTKITGDTGPCVYPAGFLKIFSILYDFTTNGKDVFKAQCIFAVIYMIQLLLTHKVFKQTQKVPPIALLFLTFTSFRIHSIYMLRLFNDCFSTLFIYIFIYLLLKGYHGLGLVSYAISLSIKMNALLYAPVICLIYLDKFNMIGAIQRLLIVPSILVAVSYPFLFTYPREYLVQAFDFSRVFLFKWSVNWSFLDEELFLNKKFHLVLLGLHVLLLVSFIWFYCFKGLSFKEKIYYIQKRIMNSKWGLKKIVLFETKDEIVFSLLFSNFIGIAFARSLHYQFYVWYYHSLVYLVFSGIANEKKNSNVLSYILRGIVLMVIEICWCVFPPKPILSLLLHGCHLLIFGITIKERIMTGNKEKQN